MKLVPTTTGRVAMEMSGSDPEKPGEIRWVVEIDGAGSLRMRDGSAPV